MELIGTVHNNSIVFDKLNLPEGKKVRVIIKDEEETKKQKLFNFIKKNKTDFPKDYRFNREELYDR
ncbi:MAG: DUF104 domain-containing protein [Fusobacteriaceae bacterium]|jgi:predicted DNA-binding antitoxin AbrB/MazE fold protein|nr:DUF104 domain-containing protein [Fusobacteriaceae bacterium]